MIGLHGLISFAASETSSPSFFDQYILLFALVAFIIGSVWLGAVAQRRIEKGAFLQGFFLGNRGLGAWALALTATVQSGGTFMGFPALVYSHGWVVALWIAGYMVVPLTAFAVVGKRLAQISRRSGAITVPDLFSERFGSPAVGLVASLLIIAFMTSMMIAQFKAGSLIMKHAWPTNVASTETPDANADAEPVPKAQSAGPDAAYYVGLTVFAVAVVGYTMIGGFLASVWTDLFQSVMMLIGVLLLLVLILPMAGGMEQATEKAVSVTGPEFATAPGYTKDPKLIAELKVLVAEDRTEEAIELHQARTGMGLAKAKAAVEALERGESFDGRAFLTPGLACSFFFIWVFSGMASPASVVRVMATESTQVLRRSILLLSLYNCMIYIPLILICVAGRALIPQLDTPDEIIPSLAILATEGLPGGRALSGLILAAPFGAVMATVSCYLLVIASGLVKDLYLRFIRPMAHVNEVRMVTYAAMIAVGLLAIAANLRPVKYLQALVVFSGSSGAATFVTPVMMACYWRRATAPGILAAMIAGAGTMFGAFFAGWLQRTAEAAVMLGDASPLLQTVYDVLGPDPHIGIGGSFRAYYLLGLDPVLWALLASAVFGIVVSLLTAPPEPLRVDLYFQANPKEQS